MVAPISPENITRKVLENGVVVLVKENHTNPSVSIRGRLRAGAMYDTDATAGIAQFASAALTRGTHKYTFQKLNETLDRVGMSIGAAARMDNASFFGKC